MISVTLINRPKLHVKNRRQNQTDGNDGRIEFRDNRFGPFPVHRFEAYGKTSQQHVKEKPKLDQRQGVRDEKSDGPKRH